MIFHLPDGWKKYSLGELFKFSNGVNTDKSAYGTGIPFANVLEVISNERLTEDMIPGRIQLPPSVKFRYQVRYGDVLFNRTSETPDEVGLSSVYVGHSPMVFGGFVLRGRPLTDDLTTDYARYAFRAEYVRAQIISRSQGAIRSNVGQRDLRSVQILLPPRSEQAVIATRIASADRQIGLLSDTIAKKKAIKEGMTQQLLTGATRLAGFGERWSTYRVGDLGTFLKGRGIKRDDVRASGVACIRYGELYTTYKGYVSSPTSFVSPTVAATALPLLQGDLLFAGSGETREEIGTCVAFIGAEPAVAGGDIIVLRALGINPVYLACLINTPRIFAQKARLGQGDAVVHINARALGSIKVVLPPREEQDAIARIVVDADTEINALRARLRKARMIKQGLMQELLIGQTRLSVANTVAV